MTSYIKPATILLKRGAEVNLPSLEEGEPAFTTDTFKLFIGSSAGNQDMSSGGGGANGLPTALSALSDANVVSPDNADYLGYNGATSKWINSPASAGLWALKSGDTFTGAVVIQPGLGLDFPNLKLVAPGGTLATCIAYGVFPDAASGLKWATGVTPYSTFSLNDCDFFFKSFDEAGNVLNDVLYMNRTGEVGLNTASPGATLDVAGSAIIRNGLRVNTAGGSTIRYSSIFEGSTGASLLFVDAPNNRVGVNVAPASPLHVRGGVAVEESGGGRVLELEINFADISINATDGDYYEPLIVRADTFDFSNGTTVMLTMSASQVVVNEFAKNVDYRVESQNNASMIFVDAGDDVIGIGGSAGSTLQVTGNVYITGSANINNVLRVNAATGRVGIGNAGSAPAELLHVDGNLKLGTNFPKISPNTTDGNDNTWIGMGGGGAISSARGGYFQFFGNEYSAIPQFAGNVLFEAGNVTTGDIRFFTQGTQRVHIDYNGGLTVAATSGTDMAGWINVLNGIQRNGTAYTNPDYAVEHYFNGGSIVRFIDNPGAASYGGLVPLDQLESYLKQNMHLPNRWKSTNLFDWADMAQMWSEELAIYITQLHNSAKEREEKISDLEARITKLENLLD